MGDMKKRKRFNRVAETVKTVVLGVLVVSLVTLVALYIRGIRVYEKVVAEKSSTTVFNKLWSVQGGVEPHGLEASRLIPEFIGYKQASLITPRGCVGNTDAVSALYDLVKPCIRELFGSGSVCKVLESDMGRSLFSVSQSGEEFIYVRYHVPVMYQAIYAYCADKLTVSEDETALTSDGPIGAYISELIIVPDNSEGTNLTIAYAHDSDGNYYEFRPLEYNATSSFYISKLANSDSGITTSDFTFVSDAALDGAEPMVDSETLCSDIAVGVASFNDAQVQDALFRLLGYNPDKLDVYDDKGADVYIDSHSRLRIGGGTVSFITSDATAHSGGELRGIAVDTLLGYSLEGTPGLIDKLTAADNFIRRLGEISPDLIGGQASLCLGEVYTDNGLLVIEYFITYNNIRIGKDTHLRMVFAEDTLCEFELFPTTVSVADSETLVPKPRFVISQLKNLGAVKDYNRADSVKLSYNGGGAEWVAVFKSN